VRGNQKSYGAISTTRHERAKRDHLRVHVMRSEAMLDVASRKHAAFPIQNRTAYRCLSDDARSFPDGPCTRRQVGDYRSTKLT
jgi:hypothetical protein